MITYSDFIKISPSPDERWAQIYRNKFHVAQRKFAAAYPGYRIERNRNRNQKHSGGTADWSGHVFYKDEKESIGNFGFAVFKTKNANKPVAEIQWLGRFAPDRDHAGKRKADWHGEQPNHRGVMTGVTRLFLDQVKDDVQYVAIDDGSNGYWEHFFAKYYPNVKTVIDGRGMD